MNKVTTTVEEKIDTPAWNMATAYLMRVNEILIKISNYSINNNYSKLYNSLIALYREITPYIKIEHQKDIEKTFAKAVNHFHDQKEYTFQSEQIRGMVRKDERAKLELQAQQEWVSFTKTLNELNIALKSIVHSSGLLMPSKEDESELTGED